MAVKISLGSRFGQDLKDEAVKEFLIGHRGVGRSGWRAVLGS